MPGPARTRVRVSIGAVVLLLLAGAGGVVAASALGSGGHRTTIAATPAASVAALPTAAPSAPTADTVFVHVVGAVRAPGLYALHDGDRVVDAVAAAGGLADDAEQRGLNLAAEVADGQQLVVPRVGEAVAAPSAASGTAAGAAGAAPGGRVDLNTADGTALDALPGIGPALAQRILQWRTDNGPFASVEDLDAVSGIGPALLERLRDLVTV